MTAKEALESLKFEVYEEGHCSFIEEEIDLAISALEKQVPKPPLTIPLAMEIGGKIEIIAVMCPNCKKPFGKDQQIKHCFYCGQALDWSEDE